MKAFFAWLIIGSFVFVNLGSVYSQNAKEDVTPEPLQTQNTDAPIDSKPDFSPYLKSQDSRSESPEDKAIVRPPALEDNKAKKESTLDDDEIIKKADELIRTARARCEGKKSVANGAGEKVSSSLKEQMQQQVKTAEKINNAIQHDSTLSSKASGVKALPQDGVLTLNGTVNTVKEKVEIEEKASKIAGKEKVISEITVSESN